MIGARVALLPLALLISCLAAGLFGAIHNQMSYTIAPIYFQEFKFLQFDTNPGWPDRLAAAWVGWQAAWWMGLLLGPLAYLAALVAPSMTEARRLFLQAVLLVIVIALVAGLLGATIQWLAEDPANPPRLSPYWRISDPVAFSRAGAMHNASYAGAALGGLIATVVTLIRALLLRRALRKGADRSSWARTVFTRRKDRRP